MGTSRCDCLKCREIDMCESCCRCKSDMSLATDDSVAKKRLVVSRWCCCKSDLLVANDVVDSN